MFKIALIGNPNCGKTTLFNVLTGTYQRTGNWTGVTTTSKEGTCKKDKNIKIIDLPGLYSLNTNLLDEKVVIEHLKNSPPDVIINVVDGTNLERNLFLTMQLCGLNIPIVLAVNFIDELNKNGITLNEKAISTCFNMPVVSVSALKNIGVEQLIKKAKETKSVPKCPLNKTKNTSEIYNFLGQKISEFVIKKQTRIEVFTHKADKILLHRIYSFPIFVFTILMMYFLSIKIGSALGQHVSSVIDNFGSATKTFLTNKSVPDFLINLTCDAIIKGISTVCSFLPQILVLFILLSIIEQSGYASRIAFILDRIFSCFGLNGKSIIPMIVSCGCTATGLSSTRSIESLSERRMTIFLTPFMPCGAKMAVFSWFSSIFFNGNALVATSMYFLAIICTAIFGKILKRLKPFRQDGCSFILEIPPLRIPSFKDVLSVLFEKVKDFTIKAGMIVFLVSVFLWLLQNIGIDGYTFGNVERSFLYYIGNGIKYIFYPLGFYNWQTSVAYLSGIFAKEAVVETLVLTNTDIQSLFNSVYSAYAFMAFILLSPPCIASIAVAKEELVSMKWFICMLIFQFLSAYVVSFIINVIGFLLTHCFGLLLSLIIVIIVLTLVIIFIKRLRKKNCKSCGLCQKGGKKCQNKKQCMI